MRLERIRWREAEPPDANALARRLSEEGFDAICWTDSPGADYPPHRHDHDESLWVVRGQITFGVAGAEYTLEPGDRLMLPRGTAHTARVGPEGATYWIGRR
jgi:quercetin dioxygenase-like cupin family protein